MIHNARKIAEVNGMSNETTFVQGRIEDANIPKVDIIVSEWMGFCLLSEIMLDCLLQARDTHLVPDGLLFPDWVSLSIAGIQDAGRIDLKSRLYVQSIQSVLEIRQLLIYGSACALRRLE